MSSFQKKGWIHGVLGDDENWGNIPDKISVGIGIAALLVGVAAGKAYASREKTVSNLYIALAKHRKGIKKPILPPPKNPYTTIRADKALIIEGPNKVGKTTMLALSISVFRRYGPWKYTGIVLDGSKTSGLSTFAEWRNNQMQGTLDSSGAELSKSLIAYKNRQWFRRFLSDIFPSHTSIAEKCPFIIVDQFEELLKRFPVDALEFAHSLTNDQVRDKLALVFFVVNTPDATKALFNLNQGIRFAVMKVDKTASELPGVGTAENERFHTCMDNIGLYKEMVGVEQSELKAAVEDKLATWKSEYHVPYAPNGDPTWKYVPEDEFMPLLLSKVKAQLESRTTKVDGKQVKMLSQAEVKESIDVLQLVLKRMTKAEIRQSPHTKWMTLLRSRTKEDVAKDLARNVMLSLSTPLEEVSAVTPTPVMLSISTPLEEVPAATPTPVMLSLSTPLKEVPAVTPKPVSPAIV